MNELKTIPADSKLPKEVVDRLNMNLASLEQALLAKDPQMSAHLRNSHALLVSYPETITLLHDDAIAMLISAAQIHTNTEIVKSVAKGKGKAPAGLSKLGVDDL